MTRHTEPTDSQRRPIKIVTHECIAHAQGSVGVHVVLQLHQEFAQHIPADALVI